ncbi:MAG: hypothetical protein PHI18_04925 [bacterium]|nr:hypothetical protein [bacterium]
MRLRCFIVLICGAALALALQAVAAPLESPSARAVTDSADVRLDKGVEFLRSTEYLSFFRALTPHAILAAESRWKTDWQTPESGTDRIRQDGRWYVGAERAVRRETALWIAASGEHFDDRPYRAPSGSSSLYDLAPRSPELQQSPLLSLSQATTAVRILRSAAGVTARPWLPLTLSVGAGPMEDRRIGSVRSGIGLWSDARVERWELSGFDQSFALDYNRETPRDHRNEDVAGRYSIFREFFQGNSNRTELAADWIGRDVYLSPLGNTARRVERHYTIRDAFAFGVTRGVRAEMSGEILSEKTEQSQSNAASASLEENQAGFQTAFDLERGRAIGRIEMGIRGVSQTIRGEILQGRKTHLNTRVRLPAPWRSQAALRLGVEKYALDTRSESNDDDRDELRYVAEIGWAKTLLPALRAEWHGAAHLDHLVYLFSRNSANNRWSRYFQLGTALRHRPSRDVQHVFRAVVSATYYDYDFETDPRTTRSTVYRRLVFSDSAAVALSDCWSLAGRFGWQEEEFGRLYWDSFEEERSDRICSLNGALEIALRVRTFWRAAAGALWDSRLGKRFPESSDGDVTIFQDLQSYGPTLRVEYGRVGHVTFSLISRALRQLQLDREDRWIITGEASGGFSW